jgi:hypothetical protein
MSFPDADILWSICNGLGDYVPANNPDDEILDQTKASFEGQKASAQLNIEGQLLQVYIFKKFTIPSKSSSS